MGESISSHIRLVDERGYATPAWWRFFDGLTSGNGLSGGDFINPKDFDTGAGDDSTWSATLLASQGKTILAPDSYTFGSTHVLPAWPVYIWGAGTGFFIAAGGVPIFRKTQHAQLVRIEGCNFSGNGTALDFVMTPTTTTSLDYYIHDNSFKMDAGVWAISLVGCREGFTQNNEIADPGNGIYLQDSVVPDISFNLFNGGAQTAQAIFYDGTGTGFSAGPQIHHNEIQGWDKGIVLQYVDDCSIHDNPGIDFNNSSIILRSQDKGRIHSNYIGSLGNNPAILMERGTPPAGFGDNADIDIHDNTFVGHATVGNLYDCIKIDGTVAAPLGIKIHDNDFLFWTRYGVSYNGIQTLNVESNLFAPRAGHGVFPIVNLDAGGNDSGVLIAHNQIPAGFTFVGAGHQFCKIRDNPGYQDSNTGITATNGVATLYVINHGCSTTPSYANAIAYQGGGGAVAICQVTGITATQIAVQITSPAGAAVPAMNILWEVSREQGA